MEFELKRLQIFEEIELLKCGFDRHEVVDLLVFLFLGDRDTEIMEHGETWEVFEGELVGSEIELEKSKGNDFFEKLWIYDPILGYWDLGDISYIY